MRPVVVTCDGCGARFRMARPDAPLDPDCPRCGLPLDSAPSDRRRVSWGAVLGLATIALAIGLRFEIGQGPHSPWTAGSRTVDVSISPHLGRAKAEVARPDEESSDEPPRPISQPVDTADRSLQPVREPSAEAPSLVGSPPFEPLAKRVAPSIDSRAAEVVPTAPAPADPPAPPRPPTQEAAGGVPARIKVRTKTGQIVVARVHGQYGDKSCVILPDGQIGYPSGLAFTDEPFRPATAEAIKQELSAGPFADFQVRQSPHYLIFFQSSTSFAEASNKLLEDLYKGLNEALRKRHVPVHEAEFPLVAVIFRTERDFRAHKQVDADVQAYYEIFSNRIYFYQTSDRDQQAPEVTALRKPQTVAHEGTHQILQNIGIQPRLSPWPLWLVEGLAEYCSPPATTRKGVAWTGLGVVNPLHMATIRDLADPLSLQVRGQRQARVGHDPRMPLVEYLVTRTELTPTDYALAWAMTHYLAMKRVDDFLGYLKAMSQMPPLEKRTPQDHLAAFRAAFGSDLAKLDKAIGTYLAKLKKYDAMPYYAVMFEQPTGTGMVRRAALVSQSPSMIRQWLETIGSRNGGPPTWQAIAQPTRTRALLAAEQWLSSQ